MSDTATTADVPWYRLLNKQHWFVFAMASLAWLFDCLDQQLFIIARGGAVTSLLKANASESQLAAWLADPATFGALVKEWGGIATMWFMIGWAIGGLVFGSLGDRFGRARMLSITVLMYSVCTGLSAASTSVYDFCIYRVITGMGVGGVFGLAVALIADSLPEKARGEALGTLQALSAVGNILAGLVAILVGYLELETIKPGSAWRWLFLVGALPAFLCVFLQFRMKEPAKWVAAKAAAPAGGKGFGSYAALFGEQPWRKHALLGMLLCVAGVVGLWGVGFFSPELVTDVINQKLAADKVSPQHKDGMKNIWVGVNQVLVMIGAFFGMITASRWAKRSGRKSVFVIGFLLAFGATFMVFSSLRSINQIWWMSPIQGFCQMIVFAGFAVYLPELFPIRLRSTGTSFCYNIGRFIAASAPFTLVKLQNFLIERAGTDPIAKVESFRTAACWMSCIYLIGLVAIFFLPETKGKPLPEDGQPAPAK